MGGSLLKFKAPSTPTFHDLQELYRSTDRIQFGVQKVEPLRAQADQFLAFLAGADPGELCTGRDALAAVLLAERAIQVEAARAAKPSSVPPPDKLPTLTDEWI
jgi:hypothetical protein